MRDKSFESLREFLIKQIGAEDEEITAEASLENDLGVSGDDGFELMIAYGKEFGVDVTKFMAADYFNAEGVIFFLRSKMKPLTVAHLYKGVLAGRLDEEVMNS